MDNVHESANTCLQIVEKFQNVTQCKILKK